MTVFLREVIVLLSSSGGSCEKIQTLALVPAQSGAVISVPGASLCNRKEKGLAKSLQSYLLFTIKKKKKITLRFTFFLAHLVFFFKPR